MRLKITNRGIVPGCPLSPPPPVLYVGCTTQPLATRLRIPGHRGVRAAFREGLCMAAVGETPDGSLKTVQRWEAHYARVLAPRVDGENRPKAAHMTPRDLPRWSWHDLDEILGYVEPFLDPPYLYVLF